MVFHILRFYCLHWFSLPRPLSLVIDIKSGAMTPQREREKAKKERKKEKKEKKERKEKLREDGGIRLKRKRQHDEAHLLHPCNEDDPNSRADEHQNKKRQCNETAKLCGSGNPPKEGLSKEQFSGSAVTEEQGEATIYIQKSPDTHDGVKRKNFVQNAVTKISVWGSLQKSREGIGNHLKQMRQNGEACFLHPSSGNDPNSRSDEHHNKKRQFTEMVMPHESGSMPKKGVIKKEQLCGGVVIDHGKLTVHSSFDRQDGANRKIFEQNFVGGSLRIRVPLPKHAGDALVRHEFHSSVIKQREPCGDVSKQTGHSDEICRKHKIVKQCQVPVLDRIQPSSREAGTAPVRHNEHVASVIKKNDLCNSVGEKMESFFHMRGSPNILQQNGVHAMGRVSAAKRQVGAAPVNRPVEVPSSITKQQGHSGTVFGQAKAPHWISENESGSLLSKYRTPMKLTVSAVNSQVRGRPAVAQGDVPTSNTNQQGRHLVVSDQAGPPPQTKGNGVIDERYKPPVKVRVSTASKKAEAKPVVRHDVLPASQRQVPVIKQQRSLGVAGEHSRTSSQTCGDGAVVEKHTTSDKVRVPTANMQTGAAPLTQDDLPISVNKQSRYSSTVENIPDFSSSPKIIHYRPPDAVEQTKEILPSIDCYKVAPAKVKKLATDALNVSKQEKEDPSFRCPQAQPLNNKPETVVSSSAQQPVTPDTVDQPSISGRKENSHKHREVAPTSVEGAGLHTAFSGSKNSRRREAKYRDLILNWRPEPLQAELRLCDDVEWWSRDSNKPLQQAISGPHNVEEAQLKVVSPSWPPRACPLPGAELYALPFVVPL